MHETTTTYIDNGVDQTEDSYLFRVNEISYQRLIGEIEFGFVHVNRRLRLLRGVHETIGEQPRVIWLAINLQLRITRELQVRY